MSTPKGMKCQPRTLASGDQVLLYSNANQIVLQLRRQVPTEEDLLAPSFKVAVSLTAMEAARLAGDLLYVALPQLQASQLEGEQAEEGSTRDS
jgi:hypothetical protein